MVITEALLDSLSAQAKANPRLRQSYDLRNSSEDLSQRMLNALVPRTVMPVYRHKGSSETVLQELAEMKWKNQYEYEC